MKKEKCKVQYATLDFYKYEKDGLVYYEFDGRESQAPEPMVNAMCGLKMLKSKKDRLVGIFFHEPFPLYQKLSNSFEFISSELSNGDIKVIFKLIV